MKKRYEKPSIKRVKLIAEEAVLTLCRVANVDKGTRGCSSPSCAGSDDTTS